jgi:hypothetical protein
MASSSRHVEKISNGETSLQHSEITPWIKWKKQSGGFKKESE